MNGLAKKLNVFSKCQGAPIHRALRDQVKNLRFNLDKLAADTGEQIAEIVLSSDGTLVDNIKSTLSGIDPSTTPSVTAMLEALTQLDQIRIANVLSEKTATGLAEFAGEPTESAGDRLFNPRRMTLDSTARQALLRACREALSQQSTLTRPQREAVETLFEALATFEDLLGSLFLGYFNGDKTLKQKYFYLSWLFWSYIRFGERESRFPVDQSCYGLLAEFGAECAITFNYTGFIKGVAGCRPLFFHGDGDQLIHFATREIVQAESIIKGNDPIQSVARFISEMDLDWSSKSVNVTLPALIPPLIMKPLIASEYVDVWYNAADAIAKAPAIVIIGYSFSVADEHFNDLVRKRAKTTPMVAVSPDYEKLSSDIVRVMGRKIDELDYEYVSGREALVGKGLVVVNQRAEDLSSADLQEYLRRSIA